MKSLAHLSDAVLRHELIAAVARDRITTAELLAHIAEFDARKLYVPEGYSSMHAYCVEELHLSEDAAAKRIQAARAARRFPDLLAALAEGRLHLSGVWLLAPHLTPENVNDLIEASSHRRKAEIEQLLARQFPVPEVKATVRPLGVAGIGRAQHAPGHVDGARSGQIALASADTEVSELTAHSGEHAPGHVGDSGNPVSLPLPERFLVQVTIEKGTYEKLRHVQALLSHVVPAGDMAQVLDRALDALIEKIDKRKLGTGVARPSVPRISMKARAMVSRKSRYIPSRVRRAVWERDEGQCTFVSKAGHRCGARRFLQFDHVEPVTRGGAATVQGIRLRCRAHNQYEAERVFGSEFMRQKREEARLEGVEARKRVEARARAVKEEEARATKEQEARAPAMKDQEARARAMKAQEARALAREQAKDVLAGLRGLGCRADQAKRAAQFVETLSCDTLEERMRAALGFINRASARFSVGGSTG